MAVLLSGVSPCAPDSLATGGFPTTWGRSAPAPLINALYRQVDTTLSETSSRIKDELVLVVQHENWLQRFLNALHDLPSLLQMHACLVEKMNNSHASREDLRKLVAAAESFLIRRAVTIRLITRVGQSCGLTLLVKKYTAGSGWRLNVFDDMRDCFIITDALFLALNEMDVSLKQCASVARKGYQDAYLRLQGLLLAYMEIYKVRLALECTCMHAGRSRTPHPGFPTVVYSWVHDRPRIFPHVILMDRGTSLSQALRTQVVTTSRAWHELRMSLIKQDDIHTIEDNWDMLSAVPLQAVYTGHSGLCRVLHLIGTARPNLHTPTYHVNNRNQWEWVNVDEEFWPDIKLVTGQ